MDSDEYYAIEVSGQKNMKYIEEQFEKQTQ